MTGSRVNVVIFRMSSAGSLSSCDKSSQLMFQGHLQSMTTAASSISHQAAVGTVAPSNYSSAGVPRNTISGVPIIISPDGSSEDEPPPNISIEESHTLMQAVLSRSSTLIANVALQIPGVRLAVTKQLKDSGSGGRSDMARELADHSYGYHSSPS